MKLHRRLFASVLFLLLSPMAANAVPIAYDWTGSVTSDGWTASGQVVIEDSDFGSSLDPNTDDFINWVFQWTDGVETFAVDKSTGTFSDNLEFSTDALGAVVTFNLCASTVGPTCGAAGDHPAILATLGVWIASTGINAPATDDDGRGSVSAGSPVVVSQVPLPGTLMLLGAGFIALGIRRGQTRTIKPTKYVIQ